MRKYWALAKSFFAISAIRKADFIGNIIVNSVQIFAIVFLWTAIYDPDKSIAGYTLSDTVIYYVIILLITYLTTANTADYIANNIKFGSFSEWLLKPRSIMVSELSRAFGEQFYRLIILIPFYLLLAFVLSSLKIGVNFTIPGIAVGAVFIMLGFLINCLFEYTLSMLAFWMDEVWSIRHFKEVVTDLLGGKRVPLAFFPAVVQSINRFLPFQFIYFIPAQYILNKHTISANLAGDLVSAFFWIIIFILLSQIIYSAGIKKYGAFGN